MGRSKAQIRAAETHRPASPLRAWGTVFFLLLASFPARGAVLYDPILEWTGPRFRVIHAPATDQLVDDPVHDIAFSSPTSAVAREHGTHGRDFVYVVDSAHSRVLTFEANATLSHAVHPSATTPFTYQSGGASAASQWDATHINLPEWALVSTHFMVPFSESVVIDGQSWKYVADLSAFTAADRVYTITYDSAANAPRIVFPAASLNSASTFSISYVISNNHTGAASTFGIGEIDQGIGQGAGPVLTRIDGSSGGPTSWQLVRSMALAANESDSTADDLFLLDAADATEKLFSFKVTNAGAVSFGETYSDPMTVPWKVDVARSGASSSGSVTVSNDTGPFDESTAQVIDANQVTGHTYSITVSSGNVTITDNTTGRILVNNCAFASLATPFLGVPGISLRKNPSIGTSNTVTTTRATTGRYLFVADTTANRIKVISAASGDSWPGDWLPGDAHTGAKQPSGADSVGMSADIDYRYTTPATVPEDYAVYTNTSPIQYGSLDALAFDPDGAKTIWTRVDDLSTAGATDKKYQLDWTTGRLTFGDGTHGAIPPAATAFQFDYTTTPDVLRYGESGGSAGQFSHPKGVAARWNASLGVFDVYVADTGNKRIQKFAFAPPNPALNLPARMDFVCQWNEVRSDADTLSVPVDLAVAVDRQSAGSEQNCYLAVADRGRHQIVIYRDTAAMTGGGSTPPAFDTVLGENGSTLGTFGGLSGVAWLRNGDNLDLYAADDLRGVIVKYQEAPGPSVTLAVTGTSTLPRTLPPSSSYPFTFLVENPPAGGTIDFYYDTASNYSSTTSKRCFLLGSVPDTVGAASWTFSASPGGTPADTTYYLFARMKDADGTTVATDQTTSSELLRIDSSAIPTLRAADGVDLDRTLYLQNGGGRTLLLQVAYPESINAVGFDGSFNADMVEVTGIAPGNAWDGTGAISVVFNQSYNNTTGKFHVSSSGIGAPLGLTSSAARTVAVVSLRAKSNALTTSNRYKNGSVTIAKATSGITGIHGSAPATWQTQSTALRLAYLGDLATDGLGADSLVPHLAPKPDGKINFADQMVFTMGWNGTGNVRDRIADLGPTTGTMPDLVSNSDGVWDVDDILAFSAMYSWAAAGGYQRAAPDGAPPLGTALAGLPPVELENGPRLSTLAHLPSPLLQGVLALDIVVQDARDLCGALVQLKFDPRQLELLSIDDGGMLRGADGSLFMRQTGADWCEISCSRLDRSRPGVDGSGLLAQLSFRILALDPSPISLSFELRSHTGAMLARDSRNIGPFEGAPAAFALFPVEPNPVRGTAVLQFTLDAPATTVLDLFDPSGRRLRRLAGGELRPGLHVVGFDGRDDSGGPLPSGVYFYRLTAGRRTDTRRLVLIR